MRADAGETGGHGLQEGRTHNFSCRCTGKPETVRKEFPIRFEEIKAAIEKMGHGSVRLIIQDGRVVQIDIVEKRRLA